MEYFTSDWHLGHSRVINFSNRPFKTVEEMNKTILENMFSKVKRGDSLYFLGDLTFSKEIANSVIPEFRKRGIKFFWITGNHDTHLRPNQYKEYCYVIEPMYLFRRPDIRIHMCHFPMRTWYRSYDNTFHLYGHVHENSVEKPLLQDVDYGKSLNVNVEFNNYMPYSLKDIIEIMATKPDNIDYICREERNARREIYGEAEGTS